MIVADQLGDQLRRWPGQELGEKLPLQAFPVFGEDLAEASVGVEKPAVGIDGDGTGLHGFHEVAEGRHVVTNDEHFVVTFAPDNDGIHTAIADGSQCLLRLGHALPQVVDETS